MIFIAEINLFLHFLKYLTIYYYPIRKILKYFRVMHKIRNYRDN